MAKLRLVRVDFDNAPELEKFEDHNIFQTLNWIKVIAHTQNAEPVVAVVKDNDKVVGRFSGLIIKKYGFRILGSTFPGWTTSYMGFNLEPSVSRLDALLALEDFAFHELKCVHIEIMDRRLTTEDLQKAGYNIRSTNSFEIDLTKDEEQLLAEMSYNRRYSIRRSGRLGIVKIEIATDLAFVDDYYNQLKDVFKKQNLVPTYSRERVKSLVEYLLPTGQLLLLRAKDKAGNCLATGIFPALNDTMYFWGGASWRAYQRFEPNEPMQWFAMLYWKARGISKYDMVGGGEYKSKYGGYKIMVPGGYKSKYHIFERLRNLARGLFFMRQQIVGKLKNWKII